MRKTIIAGNWKMNKTATEAEALLRGLLDGDSRTDKAQLLVCPPYTALETAGKLLKGSHIALGAQDISEHEEGAYTGDISAQMILTLGATYVILGHSERRQYHAETDQLVNAKVKTALNAGLTPIICVGETLEQRENNETESVVAAQVKGTLADLASDQLKNVVIAYEPVWAIGTGKTATPEQAQQMHQFIREKVAEKDTEAADLLPILYGGSMKPKNAADLLGQKDIDGGLIGGASLDADNFIGILKAAR
ncbi:triose-phosphate isomerase [candidate division GN15 bacterium]|nr:triose-phosphate isomerase [candidate division GN15 bacterium]